MKRNTLVLIIFLSATLIITAAGCQEEAATKPNPTANTPVEYTQTEPVIETHETQQVQTTVNTTPENTASQAEPNMQGPRIEFEKTVHDFGTLSISSSSKCEFKFKNIGTETLQIKNIRTTCGCTAAKLDKKTFEPGEGDAIKITYRSGSYPEKAMKPLYVLTNDPANKSVQLTIKASVAKKVEATPGRIKLSLKKENGDCPEIVIKSLDDSSFAITQVKSTADCVTADFDPSLKAKSFTVKPQVDMDKLQEVLSGDIAFILDHPSCKNVTVHFDAPPIFKSTSPTVLILNAEPGVTVTREPIWVINNYGEDFEIESVTSEKGTVKNLSVKNGGVGRRGLKLQISPPEKQAGSNSFIDNVTVKTSKGNEVKIVCRMYYKRT